MITGKKRSAMTFTIYNDLVQSHCSPLTQKLGLNEQGAKQG